MSGLCEGGGFSIFLFAFSVLFQECFRPVAHTCTRVHDERAFGSPARTEGTYLFSGYARQRRSAGHFTAAVVAGRRLPQRDAAGPPPGSDHGHLLLRAGGPARRFPRRVVAVEAEPQQRAGDPREAGEERSEQRGQTAQTCERHEPHDAGEHQHEDAVLELESGDEREQSHASQHEEQPAHHLHLVLLLSPLQEPHDQKIPEVARRRQRHEPTSAALPLLPPQVEGQEEESTSDAEQRADGLGEAREKSPQIPERVTLQAPGGEERERQDDKRADVQGRDPQQFRTEDVFVAKPAHVQQKSPVAVLFERADAALHVAVPEALRAVYTSSAVVVPCFTVQDLSFLPRSHGSTVAPRLPPRKCPLF